MRRVWVAVLFCVGCGAPQTATQPEVPAQIWSPAPSVERKSGGEASTSKRPQPAPSSPAPSASAPMTPERLASTMVSALDRQALTEEQERRRKQEEDDERMRRTMEQLREGFGSVGLGGVGTSGGSTLGGGAGIGGLGGVGRGGGGLSTGSGRGYGGSGRATRPKAKPGPKP